MNTLSPALRLPRGVAALAVFAAGAIAVGMGMVIGNPNSIVMLIASLLLGIAVETLVIFRPFLGFLIMSVTPFMMCAFALSLDQNNIATSGARYVNAFDVFLPVVFLVGYFGGARAQSIAADAALDHPAHRALLEARRKFVKASILFGLLAVVSLIPLGIRAGFDKSLEVAMFIARSTEGALMFALATWWLNSERRVRATLGAAIAGGVLLTVVNIYQVFVLGTPRAGQTWVINHPDWPVEGANETGATLVYLCAIVILFRFRWRFMTYVGLAIALLMLVLTQSRSAQLMLIAFAVLSQRKFHWKPIVAGAVLVGLALALAPEDYFGRMGRTLTFEKGSFEVYSFMIRVYGYQSAIRLFLDHWLFGVGFLGCRYLSQHYNDLGLTLLGAENLFLETAADLGLFGLGLLIYWHVRLVQLGLVVARVTRPGSVAHQFARFHIPMLVGLTIYNMTGLGVQGLIGIGQLSLWCAVMLRSAHLDVDEALREGKTPGAPQEPAPS